MCYYVRKPQASDSPKVKVPEGAVGMTLVGSLYNPCLTYCVASGEKKMIITPLGKVKKHFHNGTISSPEYSLVNT